MAVNYGSRRVVVGAHYGMRDWLSQRVTAVLMAVFTIVLLAQVIFGGPLGYDRWAAIFSAQWMKVLTFVVFVALGWHAWVGVRDIWMDATHSVTKEQGRTSAVVTLAGSAVLTVILGAKLFGAF